MRLKLSIGNRLLLSLGLLLHLSAAALHAENLPAIELRGTGVEGPLTSWAILRVGNRPDELFNVGEMIPQFGKLIQVGKKCVLIESLRGAMQSSVCFPGDKDKPMSANSKGGASNSLINERPLFELTSSPTTWIGKDGGGSYVSDYQGHQEGYLIQNLGQGAFLNMIGLEDGDLITSINEVPIRSLNDMPLAAPNLNSQMIEVEFRRGNIYKGAAIRLEDSVLEKIDSLRKSQSQD